MLGIKRVLYIATATASVSVIVFVAASVIFSIHRQNKVIANTTPAAATPHISSGTPDASYKYGNVIFKVSEQYDASGFSLGKMLSILQNGKAILTSDPDGDIYPVGYPCPWDVATSTVSCDPDSAKTFGVDINGEGKKDFVFDYLSGGDDDENTYVVYELSPQGTIHQLTAVDMYGSAVFKDLTHDGKLDIQMTDLMTWSCWQASCADSPSPTVILSWSHARQKYMPNLALMRKPPPSAAEITKQADFFKNANWCATEPNPEGGTYDVCSIPWSYALDLVYSGNAAYVQTYLDQVWPIVSPALVVPEYGFSSKDNFESMLREQLQKSPYYESLLILNNGKLF